MEFRDPDLVQRLKVRLHSLCRQIGRSVSIMHVCGSHEQSMARFGLRSLLPEELSVIMGPGCPVCITDVPEVDEAVALARSGLTVATFGDMFRVPGSSWSLAAAQAAGASVKVVYSPKEAFDLASETAEEVIFFGTGFETTAVATAAVLQQAPPENFSVLSAHKYIPPVMEIVAEMPHTRVEGFLAAGHAATITGWKIFERFVERHRLPVAIGGFEPLDILAAIVQLLEMIARGSPAVANAYPRCCTPEGNKQAQRILWDVFASEGGNWRGIAHIPNGNLRMQEKWSAYDARMRFRGVLEMMPDGSPSALSQECICGNIMAGINSPYDCRLFARECTPEHPVGACMVSSEGTCKIWHDYGGHLDLRETAL